MNEISSNFFFNFIDHVISNAIKFWNLLGTFKVAGLPFTSWLVGFFILSLLIGVVKAFLGFSPVSASQVIGSFRKSDSGKSTKSDTGKSKKSDSGKSIKSGSNKSYKKSDSNSKS